MLGEGSVGPGKLLDRGMLQGPIRRLMGVTDASGHPLGGTAGILAPALLY